MTDVWPFKSFPISSRASQHRPTGEFWFSLPLNDVAHIYTTGLLEATYLLMARL